MVSPAMEVLSVFMTPWMKPMSIQRATSSAWRITTARKQGRVGMLRPAAFRIVPGDRVVGEEAQRLDVVAGGEILEGADADVAGGHAGQHGAGQHRLAQHLLTGRHGGKRARRGHAQGRHGLAHEIFAQHRTQRGAAVATAGEGRAARTP